MGMEGVMWTARVRMGRDVWVRVQWWKAKRRLEGVAMHPITWITAGALWVAAVAYLQSKSGVGL